MKLIIGVAIKNKDNDIMYTLPMPHRHYEIFKKYPYEITNDDIQGFFTDDLTFLNRKEAFQLASVNGQLNRRKTGYNGDELFSEDLW